MPSNMTTKSPAGSWADEPYKLLCTANIAKEKVDVIHLHRCACLLTVLNQDAHAAHRCARRMVHAHNCFLRTLNSILLQAPLVPDASQPDKFNLEDVRDLLLYVEAWVKLVEHHQHIEETILFPALIKEAGAPKALMQGLVDQHAEFHDGLIKLRRYATSLSKRPDKYRWNIMKRFIESFAPSLTKHLREEIPVILSLEQHCPGDAGSAAVNRCLVETERASKNDTSLELLYGAFPALLGGVDKTFEGETTWPDLPAVTSVAVKWWFARRRMGAWRFCPCDFDGRPRELEMLKVRTG